MLESNARVRSKIFSRLALKIITSISIAVLAIQFTFIGYIERSIYASELDNVSDQQITFSEANAIYLAELISDDHEDSLYLILSAIVANPLIIGAKLEYADERNPLVVGDNENSLVYGFDIKDLNDADELVTVGKLTTYATVAWINDARATRISRLLMLVLIVFAVVLAVSVLAVQLFVGIPLRRITRAIESGERVPKIDWKSADEMGTVVSRLNFLHAQFNDRVSGLEQELSDSERREAVRISSLANATLEGILIFKDQIIVDMNKPMADLLACHREECIDKELKNVFEEEVLEFLQQEVSVGARPSMETTLRVGEGARLPVEIYVGLLENDDSSSRVAVVRDISERVAAEETMWRLAHYDSLTGLPNRRYFADNLERAILQARETGRSLTVAYLDLDNFKFINDSRGHSVGDDLLCAVAASLRDTLGTAEICARLGGDEFAIVFEEDALSDSIEIVLNNVLTGIVEGEHCKTWNQIFSVSIGVSTLGGTELNKDEILTRADLALYKAKDSGRAQVCFYSDEIDISMKRERLLVERLVFALENEQLELYYQPQVLCDSTELTGFEALLRWNDPVLGKVSAEEIVPIAEREGMVGQLGRWVLATACQFTWTH